MIWSFLRSARWRRNAAQMGGLRLGVLLLAPLLSQAAVIVSTFGPGDSFSTSGSYLVGGGSTVLAMRFTSGGDYALTSIRLAAELLSGPNGFEVDFAPDSGGQPGAALESFTGIAFPSPPAIVTLASTLNPALMAGADYWVVVRATTASATSGGWQHNNVGLNGLYRWNGAMFSFVAGISPVYDVSGSSAVPEPAGAALALTGAALLAGLKLRRGRVSV